MRESMFKVKLIAEAINNFYTDNPIVLAIRKNLGQLNIRGIAVNIMWVKSHVISFSKCETILEVTT